MKVSNGVKVELCDSCRSRCQAFFSVVVHPTKRRICVEADSSLYVLTSVGEDLVVIVFLHNSGWRLSQS